LTNRLNLCYPGNPFFSHGCFIYDLSHECAGFFTAFRMTKEGEFMSLATSHFLMLICLFVDLFNCFFVILNELLGEEESRLTMRVRNCIPCP